MVQLMASLRKTTAEVKLEVDDSVEDQHTPHHKRSKVDSSLQVALRSPLEEPSPLGLRLKKSPSFLDMIQMKLSEENASVFLSNEDHRVASSATTHDKLKASNFPASLLKIGTWEYKSRYEGDLVAKCYFAKHKLVWEVLDGGLKNKIELQWSDIVAIKADYPENGLETLDIVLARRPLFFRETNPQPRKHTLWRATSDFTGGEASTQRRHLVQCQQGFLGKHFEKLTQCDPRLNYLSQQPEILLESPYFEQSGSVLSDFNDSNNMPDLTTKDGSSVSALHNECHGFALTIPESIRRDSVMSSPVMAPQAFEEIRRTGSEEGKLSRHWDQIKVPGIHQSMSISDLVCHIRNCFPGEIFGNPVLSCDDPERNEVPEEITKFLLDDIQLTPCMDEQSLATRISFLCSLLQKNPESAPSLQVRSHNGFDKNQDPIGTECINAYARQSAEPDPGAECEVRNLLGCKQAPTLLRKDSGGELLTNLPRIASLPRFLYNL